MSDIKRVNNLDYLRGVCATCIMIFHYQTDLVGIPNSSSFLGKMGIYGVAIFYILSGLTLYHVYVSRRSGSNLKIINGGGGKILFHQKNF